MTIKLINVTKHYRTLQGRHTVYKNFNLTIERNKSIGVIGHNGAGKSTLLKLICGAELPDLGRVERNMSVSWPLAFTGFFSSDLTGTANATFCARLYNQDPKRVVDFVKDYSGLGKFMDWPVKGYSSGMRAKLGFSLSLAIKFDCILIDEVLTVGDVAFREKAARALEELRSRSSFVMVSHDLKAVVRNCDRVVIISGGAEPVISDDVTEAVKEYYYRRLAEIREPASLELSGGPEL
jgi:capsular polysaccharide transport system ATP-binding protein